MPGAIYRQDKTASASDSCSGDTEDRPVLKCSRSELAVDKRSREDLEKI